jgi:hypothetical protein
VVHAAEASAKEATIAWESATTFIKEVEDWAAIAEREAWERVSRIEVESAAMLATTHGEAEGLAQRIALLEGELVEARQAQDIAEANSRGLSDVVADTDQRREEAEREC